MLNKRKRIANIIAVAAAVVALIICIWLLFKFTGLRIPCFFYYITGLRCPGCGNTRAALSLLRLDFRAAIRYNLLFPLEFLYIGYVLAISTAAYLKGKKFNYTPPCRAVDISVLVAAIIWFIVRNIIKM